MRQQLDAGGGGETNEEEEEEEPVRSSDRGLYQAADRKRTERGLESADRNLQRAARAAEAADTGSSGFSLNVRDRADSATRRLTGGRVGISDDFSSTEDTGGNLNVGISDDFTTMEDSGGVENVLRSGGGQLQDATRRSLVQAPMSAVASLRAGRAYAVGDDEAAQAFSDADDLFTAGVDRGVGAAGLEDNRVIGGTRKAGDVLIGEGVRNILGTTTGMDVEEGDSDFVTDRWAALDTGLTVGTLGAGAVAAGAARGGARGGSGLVARLTGRSADDATGAASRAADDAAESARRTDPLAIPDPSDAGSSGTVLGRLFGQGDDAARAGRGATRSADEGASAARGAADDVLALPGRVADDVAGGATRSRRARSASAASRGRDARRARAAGAAGAATRAADDVATAVSGPAGRMADNVGSFGSRIRSRLSRSGDDAAAAGSRTADDAASAGSRSADDAAAAGSRAADESATAAQRLRQTFLGTRRRQAATAAGGTFAAAVGAEQAGLFDGLEGVADSLVPGVEEELEAEEELEVETNDGRSLALHHVEDLEPTSEFPTGGQIRRVEEFEPGGRWSQTNGYTILLDIAGDTVTILGPDGEPMQADISAAQVADAAMRADGGYYNE